MSDGSSGEDPDEEVSGGLEKLMSFLECMGCPAEWAHEEPDLIAKMVLNHLDS